MVLGTMAGRGLGAGAGRGLGTMAGWGLGTGARWGLGAGAGQGLGAEAGQGPGSRQSSECFAFRLPSCSPAAQGGGIAGGSHLSFCRLWVFAQVHGDPTLGFMK